HDVRDALLRIVHHHGELVGPQAVGALEHEVADLALHVLGLLAEPAVVPARRARLDPESPRARRAAVQAVAAGAGVSEFAVALVPAPERRQRLLDVLARTGAGIRAARVDERIDRPLVQDPPARLPHRLSVGDDPA